MINDANFLEKIILILINLIGIWFGLWVYSVNKKEKGNQWFFIVTLFFLLWVNFSYLGSNISQDYKAIFWYRLNWAAVALSGLASYFLSIFFLKEEKRYFILDKIIILVSFLFVIISIFTNYIIKDVVTGPAGRDIVFGELNFLFNIFLFSIGIFNIRLFLKKYFKLHYVEKLKIQYFLIGILIFVFANIIFNIISPLILGTTKYQNFGDYSVIFFLGFTAYAIVKSELFGMKVVITTIFVGLTTILLAVDILAFTDILILQLLKGLALFIFLYLGLSLIKSVTREIEQRKEIERLSNAKTEFISIASHQLRTPLTAVKGYISMILEGSYGKIPEKARSPMEKVYQQNDKLVKLVNDLLSLSRIESGKLQLEMQMASMEDLISSIVDIFAIQAKDKNLYLKFEKPKEQIPLIMMDADKNRQVISNIINNCLKYTEKGGVTIKLKTVSGKLQIEISDTGLGMAEAEIGKLFQSFSRGEAGARMDAGGAGLGLHIAKKFIEMQKGNIWAESAGKGKGSQFYIELPINNHNNHK